jgi:cyclase
MFFSYRRIIPCLDTKDGRLVKGVNFVNLRDVGDPAEIGEAYCRAGADEIVLLDITATVEGRKTFMGVVQRTAPRLTVPLTVGGGIAELSDMEALLAAGAAAVSVNTAAVKDPSLVEEGAKRFGSDRIVVAIDTARNPALPSGFEVVVKGGRVRTGKDAVAWAKEVEARGAGQILPTSMDTDGTQTGYDLPMTRALATAVKIPVIASGGAGTLEHLFQAIKEAGADAVLVASVFHFGKHTIREAKEYLCQRGIPVKL